MRQEDILMSKLKQYILSTCRGQSANYISTTEDLCAVCDKIRNSSEPDDTKSRLMKLAEDAHLTQFEIESADDFYARMKKKYPPSR